MNKVLICKNILTKELVEQRILDESDNFKYEVIEDAPIIEDRPNEVGKYKLDDSGNLIVVYEPKPKTEMDLINEKLDKLLGNTEQVIEDGLINMDMLISQDDTLTEINGKL